MATPLIETILKPVANYNASRADNQLPLRKKIATFKVA